MRRGREASIRDPAERLRSDLVTGPLSRPPDLALDEAASERDPKIGYGEVITARSEGLEPGPGNRLRSDLVTGPLSEAF